MRQKAKGKSGFARFLAGLCVLCVLCGGILRAGRLPALPLASLAYTGGDTDNAECGSAASLDDLTAFTWWAWIFLDSTPANDTHSGIFSKLTTNVVTAKALWINRVNPNSELRFHISRATTNAAAQGGNVPTGSWQFVALTYDETDGGRAWLGDLTTAPAQVAAAVGSGATTTDATSNLYLGNRCPSNTCRSDSLPGKMASTGVIAQRLTGDQLRILKRASAAMGFDVRGQWELGLSAAGAGTQPDLSGNGNHCTVTGATAAAHAPIARYP